MGMYKASMSRAMEPTYDPDVRALFPADVQQRIVDQAFDIRGMAASSRISPCPIARDGDHANDRLDGVWLDNCGLWRS